MLNKNKIKENISPVVKSNTDDEIFLAAREIPKFDFKKSEKSFLKVASNNNKARLSILGLGYVGSVSAACFSSRGHSVICVDSDDDKVAMVNQGSLSVTEEGVAEILGDSTERGTLTAMSNIVEAVIDTDISLVSIEVPIGIDGICDLDYLEKVSHDMGHGLREKEDYHLIVYRSMVPPKTVEGTMIPILEKASGKLCGKDFGVCFNPEFLHQGTAIKDFYLPPKIVIGAIDKRSSDYAARLYEGIEGELIHTDIESAEFIKYIDNTWQALKACFGNEVAELCKVAGIDHMESADFLPSDASIDLAFSPKKSSVCSEYFLSEELKVMRLVKNSVGNTPLTNSLIPQNEDNFDYAVNLIEKLGASRVGVVGLSSECAQGSVSDSSVQMIMKLENHGCKVSYFDQTACPEILKNMGVSQEVSESSYEHFFQLIKNSDIVFVTEKNDRAKEIIKVAKLYCPVVDLAGVADEFEGDFNYYNLH